MYFSIKEIDAPELSRWLEQKPEELRVIDVRQVNEYTAGTVQGADLMPMQTLPMRLHELERDKDLVFICRSGARSGQVCSFLQQQGFENVYNLRGGMMGWASSGLPAAQPQTI
jgi:rhodanese-related sulfurtransferase